MIETAIIVLAKAPRPGEVKTRLIPLLGAEGAAGLHARLVKHALKTARGAAFGHIELHCAPDANDPFFRYCAGLYGAVLRPQEEGDLGARMLAAFRDACAAHERALLMGCDCPALTAGHLRQAERRLCEGADAVFTPCEDGGYALVGLRRPDEALFEGIAWGADRVMADTRARLRQLGWNWYELETLWDVDRPDDYARLLAADLLDARRAPV